MSIDNDQQAPDGELTSQQPKEPEPKPELEKPAVVDMKVREADFGAPKAPRRAP